ncbi:MAG: hypothetical protein A3J80_01065 [Desulfobacula sp. RIFOXYB2_FULL_45_6]|nr:MAG: hypothetical protein A3J80_01065 [Desulfobacula sp. RIFOXYB2_FULL_45_6]
MIVFDLECLNGHIFEGWFEDKEDLRRQQEQGILTCPVCETTDVVQKLHAISIRKSSSPSSSQKAMQASQEAMTEFVEKMADYVEKNFENVGTDFTKEALKMHYGAEEYRSIRGTTTAEEDKVLQKEGIPVFKVPLVKKPGDGMN